MKRNAKSPPDETKHNLKKVMTRSDSRLCLGNLGCFVDQSTKTKNTTKYSASSMVPDHSFVLRHLFIRFLNFNFQEFKNNNRVNLLIPPHPSKELLKLIKETMQRTPDTLCVPSVYHLLFQEPFRSWNEARGKLKFLD